jgi:HPt (histidine-containing phosphotransfer) domain-containing protein
MRQPAAPAPSPEEAVPTGNQKSGQQLGYALVDQLSHNLGQPSSDPLDFPFLSAQTFDDADLERDVLDLFVAQARQCLPRLANLSSRDQADTAHLLKGSARGIGAWAAAAAAAEYEAAPPEDRAAIFPRLADAFAAVERAVTARARSRER